MRYALLVYERAAPPADAVAAPREVPDRVALVRLPDVDAAIEAAAGLDAAGVGAVEVRPVVEA